MRHCTTVTWKTLSVVVAASILLGCWPRISSEHLPDELVPSSLLEAYPYAQARAAEWSRKAFLEGASAQYKREGSTWIASRLSYVFVDIELGQYTMLVTELDSRVIQIHPPRSIEGSMVSTLPLFLEDNPLDEREALRVADGALGNEVIVSCRDPEVVLKGSGFGDHQYWGITYAAHQPLWTVVGELTIDAITGELVSLRDFTRDCQQ